MPAASNTATATSGSFTPTSTGYWCFAGVYSGDSNYNSSSDTSLGECVDVAPVSSYHCDDARRNEHRPR